MLDTILDVQPVRPALEKLVHQRYGETAKLVDAAVEIVQRRVVRYRLEVEGGPKWSVIGKVYDNISDCGFTRWRRLWEEGFSLIPEPYAVDPDLKLMLMEEAPGEPLKTLVKKRRADTKHMHALGETLARLHRWAVGDETPFTVADHVALRCAPGPAAVVEAYPDLAGMMEGILDTTARLDAQWLDAGELGWTHGDCHLGQMHVAGENFWLLDLDPMQPAHPAYDLAMVLSAFARLATDKKADYLAERRDEFLAAYFATCPWTIAARLPVYEALILLKQACKRFRWQNESGWEEAVPALVRQAAACLELLDEQPTPTSVAEVVALDSRLRAE